MLLDALRHAFENLIDRDTLTADEAERLILIADLIENIETAQNNGHQVI